MCLPYQMLLINDDDNSDKIGYYLLGDVYLSRETQSDVVCRNCGIVEVPDKKCFDISYHQTQTFTKLCYKNLGK